MANKPLPFVAWISGLALAAGIVAGCKSSGSEYISPRVEGRVVDAQTRQPIYRARVTRISPRSTEPSDSFMRKGAQHLEDSYPELTDKNGKFVIDSERALVFFNQVNWFSVDLSFEHSGYDRFVTNYTLFNATNMPSGEPVIRTGDILLQRIQPKQKAKVL